MRSPLRYLPLIILRQVIIIGIHFSFPLLSSAIVYCYIFPIVCLYDQSIILLNFQKPVTGIEPVSTAWKAAMLAVTPHGRKGEKCL